MFDYLTKYVYLKKQIGHSIIISTLILDQYNIGIMNSRYFFNSMVGIRIFFSLEPISVVYLKRAIFISFL